ALQGCGWFKNLQTPQEYLGGDAARERVDLFAYRAPSSAPASDAKSETRAKKNPFKRRKARKNSKVEVSIAESAPETKTAVAPPPAVAKADKTEVRTADIVVRAAESYLQTPYRWGGTDRRGIDCSALVMRAYEAAGMRVPRTAGDQAFVGRPVATKDLAPGDVLLFRSSQPGVVAHSGIVVEVKGSSVKFIHASLMGVRYDYLESPQWKAHFLFARRYLEPELASEPSR
ncbi:MAG: C40 family peptidase, partial [Bacteroidia bacterium]|nr:C40 family peptidase [Bacteroidia bacterium]